MEASSERGTPLAQAEEGQVATKTHYDMHLRCPHEGKPQASEEAEAE